MNTYTLIDGSTLEISLAPAWPGDIYSVFSFRLVDRAGFLVASEHSFLPPLASDDAPRTAIVSRLLAGEADDLDTDDLAEYLADDEARLALEILFDNFVAADADELEASELR